MAPVRLKARVGSPDIDRALAGAISLLEQRFPGQIRAHYLLGSWAYRDVRPESDIDLVAVFHAGTDQEAGRQARALVEEYGDVHGLDLGVFPLVDRRIPSLARVQLRDALHLYGDDIRPEIEPVDPAVWTRDQMHGMYLFTGISRGLSEIHPPLGYPKPEDEFFGLTEERKREANGKPRQGTRDLVTGAGWYATALIAHRCGIIVTRKIDVPSNYQQHVGDIWSPFVEELFTCCRDRWSYRIPSDPKDRQTLRRLCVQSQEFENHFLAVYRDFLMAELRSSVDAARQDAHRALERLPYRDSGGDTARAAMLGEDQ